MDKCVFCLATKGDRSALLDWFGHYKNKSYLVKRLDCYLSQYNFTSLAKIDGQIVGVLQGLFKEDPAMGLVEFEEVKILDTAQRKGIGSKLLSFSVDVVKKRFKKMNIPSRKIFLFVNEKNVGAQKFYEKNGFVLESEVGFLFSDKRKELLYSLDLRQKSHVK